MRSCNIGNYLIKRQSEKHIIIELKQALDQEIIFKKVYKVIKFYQEA